MEFYCSWVGGHQSARVSSRATPSWKYGSAVNFAAYDRKTWVFRVADKTYSFVDPIFDRGRMKSHTVRFRWYRFIAGHKIGFVSFVHLLEI